MTPVSCDYQNKQQNIENVRNTARIKNDGLKGSTVYGFESKFKLVMKKKKKKRIIYVYCNK